VINLNNRWNVYCQTDGTVSLSGRGMKNEKKNRRGERRKKKGLPFGKGL